MRPSFFLVPLLAVAAGCSVDMPTFEPTPAPASYEYSSSQCELGCPLTKSVVAGSMITISGHSPPSSSALTARVTDKAIGRVSGFAEDCGNDPDHDRASCRYSVDIETTKPGDETVELVDADGAVKGSATFPIRDALRVILTVESNGVEVEQRQDLFYEVPMFARVSLTTTVVDDHGDPMVFTKHGLVHEYGDETILGHDEIGNILGRTDVEPMLALKTGETEVTVHAKSGVGMTAKFRVR
jgi:hypothetical protein